MPCSRTTWIGPSRGGRRLRFLRLGGNVGRRTRGVLLHRLADAVEQRKAILAQIEALDAGKILAQAEWDVQNFIDTLRYYIELAMHVQRRSPLAVARPRGLDGAAAVGTVRVHLPLELSHSA